MSTANEKPAAAQSDLETVLRALHEIASRPSAGQDAFVALLELGRRRLALPTAIVSRIDLENDLYEVVAISGADIAPGDAFPLAHTFCRDVVERGELVAVANVGDSPWKGHPCHVHLGVETYVGVPLRVNGEVYGTLNFSDTRPRQPEFTRMDREILVLMADWIGGEIARQQARLSAESHDAGLRDLIATTQDAVVFMDADSRICEFNRSAERVFGYSAEEILGQPVTALMAEPYATEHAHYVARYEQTGETRAIGHIRVVSARRKNGEVFPVELSVTEMRGGDTVRYGAFLRDISERVSLRERLVERERLAMIGTTAAMFAHEIGNPLNGISLQLQLMQRRAARDEQVDARWVEEKADLVRGQLQRLVQLLDEFRSLSRRQRFEFSPCDIGALVREVVERERAGYESRDVEVLVQIPLNSPDVLADSDKLMQVALNLCKNAVEAMEGQPGRLSVRGTIGTEDFVLEVADTGPGISPDVDVFQPFVTTKKTGTGLGLPIVKQIVAAHDGVVDYVSVPGEGTTFSVRLPLVPAVD